MVHCHGVCCWCVAPQLTSKLTGMGSVTSTGSFSAGKLDDVGCGGLMMGNASCLLPLYGDGEDGR